MEGTTNGNLCENYSSHIKGAKVDFTFVQKRLALTCIRRKSGETCQFGITVKIFILQGLNFDSGYHHVAANIVPTSMKSRMWANCNHRRQSAGVRCDMDSCLLIKKKNKSPEAELFSYLIDPAFT